MAKFIKRREYLTKIFERIIGKNYRDKRINNKNIDKTELLAKIIRTREQLTKSITNRE